MLSSKGRHFTQDEKGTINIDWILLGLGALVFVFGAVGVIQGTESVSTVSSISANE